jgi:hypothetical protein
MEVEAAHFVRAVVGAVPRADTAVVDHVVQPFVAVRGRADRADHLAGGVFALHARHGLEIGFRVVRRTAVIGVHAQPVHLAPAQHLFLADDRDGVLGLAADHAGVAADAGVDVDRHPPLVAVVLEVGIQRDGARRRLVVRAHGSGIADELVARDRAHHPAAFHQVVVLRAGERELLAGACDLDARPERQRVGRADGVGVEPGAAGDAPAARAPVAEVHGDAVVRMADDLEQRAADRAAVMLQLDDVGDDLAVLAALERRRFGGAELRGRRGAGQHRVVPRQPCGPLRQLLQPAVVGEAAVEDRRVVAEGNLQTRRGHCGLRIGDCGLIADCGLRIAG